MCLSGRCSMCQHKEEEKKMFEVGKKYKACSSIDNTLVVVECKYTTDNHAILQGINNVPYVVIQGDPEYTEWIEPIVHKRYIVWWTPHTSSPLHMRNIIASVPFSSKKDATYAYRNTHILEIQEISYEQDPRTIPVNNPK